MTKSQYTHNDRVPAIIYVMLIYKLDRDNGGSDLELEGLLVSIVCTVEYVVYQGTH